MVLPRLEYIAHNELKDVHVYISGPYHYPGPGRAWKEGKSAYVKVTITNHTGCKLDNIVCRVTASGAARIRPYLYDGVLLFDGEESQLDLERDESFGYWVRLHAHASGPVRLRPWISAEVEPYADRYRGEKDVTVFPR